MNSQIFLAEEISKIKQQQAGILGLVEEGKALWLQKAEKDWSLAELEGRLAKLEWHC